MRFLDRFCRLLCVAGSAIGGAVIAWAWLRTGYFVSPVKIAIYLVLPGLMVVSGLALLAAPADFRAIAVLVALGLGGGIAGHEIYWQTRQVSRSAIQQPVAPALRALPAPAGDERGIPPICGQTVMVENDEGSVASRFVVDGERVQILAGPAKVPVSRPVQYDGGLTVATSDRHGFNNPPGQWVPGAVEVVAIGDSFAYGADVAFGRGMVDLIRERLGRTVNLACGGNGPLLGLASLNEFGPMLRPRQVLWFYYEGNDLTKDVVAERRSATLMRYLDGDFTQGLASRQTAIDSGLMALAGRYEPAGQGPQDPQSKSALDWRDLLRLTGLRSALGMSHEFSKASLDLFEDVLVAARRTVAGWRGRLVLVFVPGEQRFTSSFARWDADGYREAVLEVARRQGIPTIDLVPVFQSVPAPRTLFAGHFSEAGYRRAAEAIVDALKR